MTMMRSKRTWMWAAVLLASRIVACGPGEACESDDDVRRRNEDQQRMFEQIRRQQASAEAKAATPTSTAAPTKAAAPASTATPPTPDVLFGGKLGLGYDHPPFLAGNDKLGGASAGIVCGSLTGIPGNGFNVTVSLSGGTGAPATVTGLIGPDGGFIIPFPINSYGPMEATITGVKNGAGKEVKGSVPKASQPVAGGADVPCTPK